MSDKELIDIFRNPESKNYGFHLIVRKFQEKIYWHIRRMVISHEDADDLVQETFIKVWKNLDHFRMESGLFTWIYRIATNETLSFLKSKNRLILIPLVNHNLKLLKNLKDDNYFDSNEIEDKFQRALLKLPGKQRMVFNMKYFENMKYEEISEIIGTSVGALKASYHHAVKKIEKELTGY